MIILDKVEKESQSEFKELVELLKIKDIQTLFISTSLNQSTNLDLEGCKYNIINKPFNYEDFYKIITNFIEYEYQEDDAQNGFDKSKKVNKESMDANQLKLYNEIIEIWNSVKRALVLENIKIFAKKLKEFASLIDNPELIEYAEQLIDYSNSINIEKIISHLPKLSNLLNIK